MDAKWEQLAKQAVSRSKKSFLAEGQQEDLYQAALLGLCEAKKSYQEDKGSFAAYANWFMQGEINRLIYRRVEGKLELPPIDTLSPNHEVVDTNQDELMLVEEFLDSIPLSSKEKCLLRDMAINGEMEATKRYIDTYECSKQTASRHKKLIREKARLYIEELEI